MRLQGKVNAHLMEKRLVLAVLTAATVSFCFCGKPKMQAEQKSSERDTCEGPDVSIECNFVDFPDSATSTMTIADENEPGTRIILKGRLVYNESGLPVTGAKLYAYQTDNTGHYTKEGNETGPRKFQGRLFGRCVTDQDGYYEIRTIRPGKYPSGDFPAHIHVALKIKGGVTTYLNDYVFSDDESVDEKYLLSLIYPGDNGVIELKPVEGILTGFRLTKL